MINNLTIFFWLEPLQGMKCICVRKTRWQSHILIPTHTLFHRVLHSTQPPQLQARPYSASFSLPPNSVVFSGIQPTGIPHLGNYLGALKQWVDLQNHTPSSTKLLFSIVDLHALTVRHNADKLRQWKKQTLAILLAIGLDPKRSTIFFQSDVRKSGLLYDI